MRRGKLNFSGKVSFSEKLSFSRKLPPTIIAPLIVLSLPHGFP